MSVSGEAGDLLATLVPEIDRTAKLVGEITVATREQSIGTEQIQTALRDLEKAFHLFDELSAEAAKASDGLEERASLLGGLVSKQSALAA